MISRVSITILLILIIFLPSYAQKRASLDSLDIAEAYIDSENFGNAIRFYKGFLLQDPNNAELNFKLGFCLLNTPLGKKESIEYLNLATTRYKRKKGKNSLEYIESYFYLARAYRSVYQFDEALTMFKELKEKVRNWRIKREIDLEISLCENGINLIKKKVQITLNNMGEHVNSRFSDHSPVFSADESVLIFTSRRKNLSGGEADMDGRYDEDIFISEKDSTGWSEPRGISPEINTSSHEATIGLSIDGQTLLIYKGEDEGSIYISKLFGKEWSKPMKLGDNINTKYRETHASLSADGKYLFFTSDRKGGYGGLDIYMSEIQEDGTWGEPKNLGDAVNSKLDEEGPYIHPDGTTLFFSSEGHNSLGGYDIFKSTKNQFKTWTIAENIGYPINTVEDDVYYLPTPDGKRAYFSSDRSGSHGENDIFLIDLHDTEGTNISVMVGVVYVECTNELPRADITVTDNETGKEWFYVPNSHSGKFVLVVTRGKSYSLDVNVNGESVFTDNLDILQDAPYQQFYDSVRLDSKIDCREHQIAENKKNKKFYDEEGNVYDASIAIENILFGFDKKSFLPNENIDTLVLYLKKNPGAVVEIGAYADSRGSAIYNYYLTRRRGNAVKKHMIRNGVKENQVIIVGYGEENPIAYNKVKNKYSLIGQKYNRRAEFRVLKQGKTTLLIRSNFNIPDELKSPFYGRKYKKKKRNDIETTI